MRRSALALTTVAAATAALFAPVASAQTTNVVGLISLVNGGIETADCASLDTVLTGLNLVDEDTTRSELVSDLNAHVGDDLTIRLLGASTISTIGDRALECGIVQPDPETPFGSSQLAEIPGVGELVTLSSDLSSTLGV